MALGLAFRRTPATPNASDLAPDVVALLLEGGAERTERVLIEHYLLPIARALGCEV